MNNNNETFRVTAFNNGMLQEKFVTDGYNYAQRWAQARRKTYAEIVITRITRGKFASTEEVVGRIGRNY